MEQVSVRDLRNYGGQILDRVAAGESMTITRDGNPVAVLAPIPAPRLGAAALLAQWTNVPVINADELRSDVERVIDLDL